MKSSKNEAHMNNAERLAVMETTLLNINSILNKIEDRLARIENRLWSNFLWIISMLIGLAGLIAHLHHLY